MGGNNETGHGAGTRGAADALPNQGGGGA